MTDQNQHMLVLFLGSRKAQKELNNFNKLAGGQIITNTVKVESPTEDTDLQRLWEPFYEKLKRTLKNSRITHIIMRNEDKKLLKCVEKTLREVEKEGIHIKIISI